MMALQRFSIRSRTTIGYSLIDVVKVVRAASLHDDSTTADVVGKESAEGLKHMLNQTSSVDNLLENWMKSQAANSNTMNQCIANINRELVELNKTIVEQHEMITWLVDNTNAKERDQRDANVLIWIFLLPSVTAFLTYQVVRSFYL